MTVPALPSSSIHPVSPGLSRDLYLHLETHSSTNRLTIKLIELVFVEQLYDTKWFRHFEDTLEHMFHFRYRLL